MSIPDGGPNSRWTVALLMMLAIFASIGLGSHAVKSRINSLTDELQTPSELVFDAEQLMGPIPETLAHYVRQHPAFPTVDLFLIALVAVGSVFLVVRRIDWVAAMHPPMAPRSETMIALLRTKQWVNEALSSKGKGRLLIQLWSPSPRAVSSRPMVTFSALHQSGADPNASTIEKLLALKRQQEQR